MAEGSSNHQLAEISRLLDEARPGGEGDASLGKRSWSRHTLDREIEVSLDLNPPFQPWSANLYNISGGGIAFWSKKNIEPDTAIVFRVARESRDEGWISGVVKHCTMGVRGYLVGLAFDEHLPSETDERPESAPATQPHVNLETPPRQRAMLNTLRTKSLCACAAICAIAAGFGFMVGRFVPNLDWRFLPLIFIGAALLFGATSGFLMTRRETVFLESLRLAISELTRGNVEGQALPFAPSMELGGLRKAVLGLSNRWRQRLNEERIQRQKLEEVTRIKSNILAIVSHDLRTPLTSILLYTQMLTEEIDDLSEEDRQRFLGIVEEECNRLSRLLDDLLEVQRLESGSGRWDLQTQDLSDIVRRSVGVFDALAVSKGIELTTTCPESLPSVEVDGDKISQVLSNLISNALKYTQNGGRVAVSAEARGPQIVIRVADNGPGIPREKWDHIFDRFIQLADPNVSQIEGFGLGLNIVKKIVEGHGGSVWCDSEVGKGTEFYVSLPTACQGDEQESAPAVVMPSRRVVVCDADPELAASMAQALRFAKFEVSVVHSGSRMLAMIDHGDVDIVITDVLLPDMSAGDLLESLRMLEQRTFRLIIHSYAGDGHELITRYGADIFLRRPVSKNELVLAAQTSMRRRESNGLTAIVIESKSGDTSSLVESLSNGGHVPIVAESIEHAVELMMNCATDAIVVRSTELSSDWPELASLKEAGGCQTRTFVMCDTVRRRDKAVALQLGVTTVGGRLGCERELLDAMAERKSAFAGEIV